MQKTDYSKLVMDQRAVHEIDHLRRIVAEQQQQLELQRRILCVIALAQQDGKIEMALEDVSGIDPATTISMGYNQASHVFEIIATSPKVESPGGSDPALPPG